MRAYAEATPAPLVADRERKAKPTGLAADRKRKAKPAALAADRERKANPAALAADRERKAKPPSLARHATRMSLGRVAKRLAERARISYARASRAPPHDNQSSMQQTSL